MTVFRAFLKVLGKCKITIIIYTAFLIFFGAFSMETNDKEANFSANKPTILIINHDENKGLTENFITYIEKNSEKAQIKTHDSAIRDALFYRDVHLVVYIPKDFRKDFLSHKNPTVEIKGTGDYQSSLAEMIVNKYLKTAKIYEHSFDTESDLISNITNTLSQETTVEITSKLDSSQLNKVAFYYNFANYCILAGCIYVICLILSSFKEEKIRKRTIISSINYKVYNRQLLLSNSLFAMFLWGCYVLISIILLGGIMFTTHGLLYILNSFVFTFCALTIAFLIGNLVANKNAINGIVNIIALGSSFLCGAFVPMQWLPTSVLNIAHILPSYWYIKSNELLKTVETFTPENLKPLCFNMLVLVAFSILFIIITNYISRKKRKIS